MAIVLILATGLAALWAGLLFMVKKEDWLNAAKAKLVRDRLQIVELAEKARASQKKLERYHGISRTFMKLILDGDEEKKIRKLEKEISQLQSGKLSSLGVLDMPGYVVLRLWPDIASWGIWRNVRRLYFELYGKKYPDILTRQLFARLISYPLIGVSASLALGALFYGVGKTTIGLGIMGGGSLLVLVLVYALYDEVADLANKRRDQIVRAYPNVVSKLALLVTAGMIMDRAWNETAQSGEGELYRQMRLTSEELDNLMRPEDAYGNFIDRCNTKETTKLASAIMQNLTKGNAEIGLLLKQMAAEAWEERKNLAKRDSENANSKLMIPTMLLFGSILLMIMVPVVMSFGSF